MDYSDTKVWHFHPPILCEYPEFDHHHAYHDSILFEYIMQIFYMAI